MKSWYCRRAGGVIRDHLGKWVVSFSCHVKIASKNKAELLAVRHGLITALDMGVKFLNVNVDSTFVLTVGNLAPKLFPIISDCRMLLSRE